MAVELYLNPDGSAGGLDAGKVMVAPTQGEFEDCCCEEGDEGLPCSACCCEYDQDNAIVTATGNAWEGRPPPSSYDDCWEMEGAYVFDHAEPISPGKCLWLWIGPTFWSHSAEINVTARLTIQRFVGAWAAQIALGGLPAGSPGYLGGFGTGYDMTIEKMSCSRTTHKLSCIFDLEGVGEFGCAPYPPTYPDGCTAHVTIG